MAEYCKDCAKEYGMKNDEPCFCEGCKKYVDNSFSFSKLFFKLKSLKTNKK